MTIFDRIAADPASTDNEKLMAMRAKKSAKAAYSREVFSNLHTLLSICSVLNVTVEYQWGTKEKYVIHGDKRVVKWVEKLANIWDQNTQSVNNEILKLLLEELPINQNDDKIELTSNGQKVKFVKTSESKLELLTSDDKALALQLAKWIMEAS